MNKEDFYPVALTIAESDSSGGSGIQADLRTFNAAGVYCCSAITAVTAQNPRKITSFEAMPAKLVREQIKNVMEALSVKAVKTGFLVNADIVETVADALKDHRMVLIVDATVAAPGKRPDSNMLQAMKNSLLPLANMITANVAEAEYLLDCKLANASDLIEAAKSLAAAYQCNVLLKTGFAADNNGRFSDIAVLDDTVYTLNCPDIPELEELVLHGAESTFSSAITAMLACGGSWKDALKAAKAHVYGALNETAHIGRKLDAMYPPLEDYSRQISLSKINSNAPCRKGSANAR